MSAITITGNLTREPELRFTASGRAVANLSVAENHRVRNAESEWTDGPTTFWPVTVWGEYAEHVAESLTKGDRVVVMGRTGTRTWTPTDGEKAGVEQSRIEVVAEEVTPSLRWATAKLAKAVRSAGQPDVAGDDEPPF